MIWVQLAILQAIYRVFQEKGMISLALMG